MQIPQRIIIGMSGASGIIYGIRLLEILRQLQIETHLILSRAAEITIAHETDYKITDIKAMANVAYRYDDIGSSIASGSFQTMGMIVSPCSARFVCAVANGGEDNLL